MQRKEQIYIGGAAKYVIGYTMFKHKYSKICDKCKQPRGNYNTIINNEIDGPVV